MEADKELQKLRIELSFAYGQIDKYRELVKTYELRIMKPKVYVAMHNPMIHESTYGIISIHETRKMAEMAMEFDKAETIKENGEEYCSCMAWAVFEVELLD